MERAQKDSRSWKVVLAVSFGPAAVGLAAVPSYAASRAIAQSSAGSKLEQIEAAAQGEAKATFKLTYNSKSSGGATQVTFEQKLPQQLFRSGSGEVIFTGKKTYYCALSGNPPTCVVYSAAGQSPLAGMISFYSASTYIGIMRDWQSLIAAHIAGYRIDFSQARFAGQPSECVTWSYQGSTDKYCVTDKGILAYSGSSGGGQAPSSFTLTFYSGRVSSSDFSLPKGATIAKAP